MDIDPNNLAATATLTFNDDFNMLNLRRDGAGVWDTKYEWGAENGQSLNDQKNWYINADYDPTKSIQPWSVEDGVLSITAEQTPEGMKHLVNGFEYTSGIMMTVHSFTQQYGYFEMRAQMPDGDGTWPAFWLLPANGAWPPEIDVMEQLGKDPNMYYVTSHSLQTGEHLMEGKAIPTSDLTASFHTYGVEWDAENITYYLDGQQVHQSATSADMHQPMYMLVNLGVGGHWPGDPATSDGYSETMKVDYIRAYASKENAGPVPSSPEASSPSADQPPLMVEGSPQQSPAEPVATESVLAEQPIQATSNELDDKSSSTAGAEAGGAQPVPDLAIAGPVTASPLQVSAADEEDDSSITSFAPPPQISPAEMDASDPPAPVPAASSEALSDAALPLIGVLSEGDSQVAAGQMGSQGSDVDETPAAEVAASPTLDDPFVLTNPSPVATEPALAEQPMQASSNELDDTPPPIAAAEAGSAQPVSELAIAGPVTAAPHYECGAAKHEPSLSSTAPPPQIVLAEGDSQVGLLPAPAGPESPAAPPAPLPAGPEASAAILSSVAEPLSLQRQPADFGDFDAFLGHFNSAPDDSFQYLYCATSGAATEAMRNGRDLGSTLSEFFEGRGFGTFHAERSPSRAEELSSSGMGSSNARHEGGSDPGLMIGHLALDDATRIPVFTDHWTV